MDVAFLGGEGEAAGGSGSPRSGHKRFFDRRSDAIAYGSPYQKAAALVDLAEDGIGIPEEIFDQPSFGSSLKSYLIFIQFDFLWSLNYFALILLNFLEKPLWCSEECSNRDYYYLGQLPYLTGAESLIYEGVTLLILIVHIVFPITYEGFSIFWKSRINKLTVLLLLILIIDLLVYVIYLSPVASYTLPVRLAPYIRVVLFALNISEAARMDPTFNGCHEVACKQNGPAGDRDCRSYRPELKEIMSNASPHMLQNGQLLRLHDSTWP